MGTAHSALPRSNTVNRVRPGYLAGAPVLTRLGLLAALLGAVWFGLMPLSAVPDVVPASAPAATFSAERAMRDVTALAAKPRPVGSAEAAAARDYLLAQIAALGLKPEVQYATVADGGPVAAITAVENVIVRLPGREGGRALLITGHYDSVPTSPGAYDCASCSATVLETLRVLKAGPPLKNDVIFLFTDGEEVHTMGAQAFVESHPWARDVALTLVYEGYGSTGADILYATGADSGWLTGQALASGAHLTGYSFMNSILGALGGSGSDLEALLSDGRPGLAFIAFSLATVPSYHTWADNIANLDPRTLQSHGDNAVALVRRLANLSLTAVPRQANAVYFPLAPGLAVQYPAAAALPLAGLALVLFVVVLALGLLRRRLSAGALFAGVLTWLASLLVSLALVTVAWWLIRRLNPNLHGYRVGGWYDGELYLLAFIALAVAVTTAFYWLARRRFAPASLATGALVWWALLGALVASAMPGLSYVFTWPLLAALLMSGRSFIRSSTLPAGERAGQALARGPAAGIAAGVAAGLPALVGVALIAPLVYFLAVFGGRLEALTGFPGAGLPFPFVLLLLGLLLPMTEYLAGRRLTWVAGAALGLCLVLLVAAWLRSGPTAARPTTNTVVYQLDANAERATWLTVNDSLGGRGTRAQLDAWTVQFVPTGAEPVSFNPWTNGWMDSDYPALQAAAPALDMPRGALELQNDESSGGARRLRLHLTLAPQTLDGQVLLSADGPLADVVVNGSRISTQGAPTGTLHLNFNGRFADGLFVQLKAPASALSVTLVERTPGLPAIPGLTIRPRPATMIPAPYNSVADSTLVRQSWRLAP